MPIQIDSARGLSRRALERDRPAYVRTQQIFGTVDDRVGATYAPSFVSTGVDADEYIEVRTESRARWTAEHAMGNSSASSLSTGVVDGRVCRAAYGISMVA